MRYAFIFLAILYSCTESVQDEIYQGNLNELGNGNFILEKDSTTKYIHNLQVIQADGKDLLILSTAASNFEGVANRFYDLSNGELIHQIGIPKEGPESLKGGAGYKLVVSTNKIVALSPLGYFGMYDSLGKKTEERKVELNLPRNREDYVSLEARKGLMVLENEWLQIGQNPSNSMKFFDPKERLMKAEFPLGFNTWLSQINVKTGEVRHSDFFIPGGYEKFQNDVTATYLMGAFDSKREDYYLAWPYSDTIYHLKGLKLEKKFMPVSSVGYNFIPSEVIPWGETYTVWALPKEASEHVFLLYDQSKDLFVRLSKTHESGAGETKFERTKHYVLSVYSGEWESLGDYFFDFQGELDVENWFLTSKGLFINKPEQPNEDEYEFYSIDLSRVKK